MIFAIFNLSGNVPDANDKLISDNNGSEITSIDFLITEIGILSAPGALPSLKLFVIEKSSSRVTGANSIISSGDELLTNSLKDFEGRDILLTKFGPIFVKYWQNLLAIISGLDISWPLSCSCNVDDAFLLFRLITLFNSPCLFNVFFTFVKLHFIVKLGLHLRRKHKHKDVYTYDKHKHKVTYSCTQAYAYVTPGLHMT